MVLLLEASEALLWGPKLSNKPVSPPFNDAANSKVTRVAGLARLMRAQTHPNLEVVREVCRPITLDLPAVWVPRLDGLLQQALEDMVLRLTYERRSGAGNDKLE